jgi:hypothetical protein
MNLPSHPYGLTLNHNDHKSDYLTVADLVADWEEQSCAPDWPSEEAKERAVATNEIWTLRWYPYTPVGQLYIAAPTLEELLTFAEFYATVFK